MRNKFKLIVNEVFESRKDLFLLLGDIGVFGFNDLLKRYPQRAINIGILEQSMVGLVAGLSKAGLIPIIHSIAPFLVERAFEQIKLAVGYHDSNCRLISIGASYDYINLGPTHHCPSDVAILSTIPNMHIVVPASAMDFERLFKESLDIKAPIYFRLTDNDSKYEGEVEYGRCRLLHKSSNKLELILSIGPMIDLAESFAKELNVTHLNCTTLTPFDCKSLFDHLDAGGKLNIIEPYYEGSSFLIISKFVECFKLRFYGFKRNFQGTCGSFNKLMEANSLTLDTLRERYYERN
jgi:transketolase